MPLLVFPENPTVGQLYRPEGSDVTYEWNEYAWDIISKEKEIGPQGPQGIQGIQGEVGPVGPVGPQGAKGDQGDGLRIEGSVTDPSLLPTEGNTEGDCYLIAGHIWTWHNGAWVDAGKVEGPQGPQGIQGEVGPQGPIGTITPEDLARITAVETKNTEQDGRLAGIDTLGGQLLAADTAMQGQISTLNTNVAGLYTIQNGAVILWDKSIAQVPPGYLLCDGNNGTRNLLADAPEGCAYLIKSAVNMPTDFTISYTSTGKNRVQVTSSPTAIGTFYMGDYVAEIPAVPAVPGTPKLVITATENYALAAYCYNFAIETGVTGSWSYGDPAATVNTSGQFIYPAIGDYTVTFTNDADAAVTTMTLSVLEVGTQTTQTSPNQWLVDPIPEVPLVPALPETVLSTMNGTATCTYRSAGTFTVRFVPFQGNEAPSISVESITTAFSITATPALQVVNVVSSPAAPGVYTWVPEVPAVIDPNTGTETTPAVPAITTTTTDGVSSYDYAAEGTYTISFKPDDGNDAVSATATTVAAYVMTVTPSVPLIATMSMNQAVAGTYSMGNGVAEIPPVMAEDGVTVVTPAVPAVPAATVVTTSGAGTYTYASAGTYNVTFVCDNGLTAPAAVDVAVASA
jgi:hypothetical protein